MKNKVSLGLVILSHLLKTTLIFLSQLETCSTFCKTQFKNKNVLFKLDWDTLKALQSTIMT